MTVILIIIDRGEDESRNPPDKRELKPIPKYWKLIILTNMKISHR